MPACFGHWLPRISLGGARRIFLSASPVSLETPHHVRPLPGSDRLQLMCQKLAASHYVLDFGHVVKGSAKVVRRFRLYNYGHRPVSFRFDRNVLEAHGLKVRQPRVWLLLALHACAACHASAHVHCV